MNGAKAAQKMSHILYVKTKIEIWQTKFLAKAHICLKFHYYRKNDRVTSSYNVPVLYIVY